MFLDQQLWLKSLIVRCTPLNIVYVIFNKNTEQVKVGVQRPEVRYSKQCASMTDRTDALIWTFCIQMAPDKSLKKEILTHGLITWAKFGPLKFTSKLHFQI